MGRSTCFSCSRFRALLHLVTFYDMTATKKISALLLALGIAAAPAVAHAEDLDATGVVFRFGYEGQVVTDSALLDTPVPVGTSLLYSNIATIGSTVIDGLVTFVDGENLIGDCNPDTEAGFISRIDDVFPSDEEDPFVEASICAPGDPNVDPGFAVVRINFYVGGTYTGEGTGTPVSLANLVLNVYDIDGLQAIEVPGAIGYAVSTNTHLTVTEPVDGTYVFQSPNEVTDGDDGTAYTVGRAKVALATASSVTVTIFVPADSSGGFDFDLSNGLPWTDSLGGGEDTTNLPPVVEDEDTLPETGSTTSTLLAAALGAMLVGTLLTRVNRRRTA